MTGPNRDQFFQGKSCNDTPSSKVSPPTTRVPRRKGRPTLEIITLHVLWNERLGRCGYLALGFGRRKFLRGTAGMCLVRHVASSLLSLPPAMSPMLRIKMMLKRTTSMEYPLFPIVWNSDITHQFRFNHDSPSVPLNCTKIQKGTFRTFTVPEPHLVASSGGVAATPGPTTFVLLCFQMLSAVLDPSYSGELLRQFLAHLDHNGAPIS